MTKLKRSEKDEELGAAYEIGKRAGCAATESIFNELQSSYLRGIALTSACHELRLAGTTATAQKEVGDE